MFKRGLTIIICLCLCLSFCGCFGSPNDEITVDISTVQGKINNSVLQYPATNKLFRYNVYTYYVTITECLTDDTEILIPDTINELPVLGIEDNAFAENSTMKSITLGQNVANIGENAFLKCVNLESVITSQGLLSIGESAFQECEKLRSIIIPGGVTIISPDAFNKCTSLKSVTIEECPVSEESNEDATTTTSAGIFASTPEEEDGRTIDSDAFSECPVLSYVWIPNDIMLIDDNAFDESMEYLTIYGYAASQAAIFSAKNLINFVVLDKLQFSDMVSANINNYPTIGSSIQTSTFRITLNNANNQKTVGTSTARDGNTYVIFDFTVENITDKPEFFNALFASGMSNNVSKHPVYFSDSSINQNILAGTIAPATQMNGYIAFEVNENYSYVLVDFNDIAGFESIDSIMAVYK